MDREKLLETKPLYKREAACQNEIFKPLDELVPGASARITEFYERCEEDSSKFEGRFWQGLCHNDLNWKNVLKGNFSQLSFTHNKDRYQVKCLYAPNRELVEDHINYENSVFFAEVFKDD